MKKALLLALCLMHASLTALTQLGVAREWLEKEYLPALQGKILYVGVGVYTRNYHLLTQDPHLFETIDFVAEKAPYGSPHGHYIAEFLNFQPNSPYDHICLFGVMGHPPHTPTSIYSLVEDEAIFQACQHAHRLLKIGGTLQLGPSYIAYPRQDKAFWLKKFSMPLLKENYRQLFLGLGSDNIVWWGEKIGE